MDYVSYLRIAEFTAASRPLCRFDEKFLYGEDEFCSPSNYQCVFQGAQGASGIPGKKGEQGPKVTS